MGAEFMWRKTASHYALLGWSGVLVESELCYEYLHSHGPKFWYVPPIVDDAGPYGEHIRLGGDYLGLHKRARGTIVTGPEYYKLVRYLHAAGKRLSDINKEVAEGEEFTVKV